MKTKDKVNFSIQQITGAENYQIKVQWSYGFKVTDMVKKTSRYELLRFATGFTIPDPSFWDEKMNRVKNLSSRVNMHINSELDKIENRILIIYNDYIRSGATPSPDEILSQLENARPILKGSTKTRFYDFCVKHAHDSNNSENTVKGYIQYANKIKMFEEHIRKQIYIEQFDREMYKQFLNFIYSLPVRRKVKGELTEMPRSENDVWRYKTSTKTFLTEAKKQKIKLAFDDFENEVKASKIQIDAVWFNDEMLEYLFNLDLKKYYSRGKDRSGLENTRVWILVSSLTGLRYSDWRKVIQPKFIDQKVGKKKVKVMVVRQFKTDNLVKIPVYDKLHKLYVKYNYILPEPATEQKYNEAVKELCKIAGFTHLEDIRQIRGKNQTKTYSRIPFNELVSTHTGRRSLANRMYLKGVPPQIIKMYSGHKNVSGLLNYLKIKDEELLANYFEKFSNVIEESLNV